MSQVYTSGRWTVLPGREDEFVAAWSELAQWTFAEVPGSSWARLLQHQEKPNVFVSFSPWQSADAIAAWRESPGFQGRVEGIRGMLENFEPEVFDSRVEIGPT